ncbi:MAG: hypothetical protein ACR2OH_06420, partial [Microthrixaceae bacterium]
RRRWVWLLFCASLGASLGYSSTLFEDEPVGPIVQHWAANELLISPPEIEGRVDLQAISIYATAGEVPEQVAADLGIPVDDLTPTLRTVADGSVRTLTVSAVATSAEDALLVTESISVALLDGLNREEQAEFGAALLEANAEVEAAIVDASVVQDELDAFERSLPPEEERTSSQQAQLRALELRTDAAVSRITAAQEAVRVLESTGPAPAPLQQFETIPPLRISQREYNNRIAQGRQGQNNFFVGEVDLADTSRPTVSERLESPIARAALGALAGFLIGMLTALAHIRLDPRLRSKDQVEAAFGVPVLTEIPEMPRRDRKDLVLHSRERPRSVIAEAYRYLRSVLLFARAGADADSIADGDVAAGAESDRDVRVLMITSSGEGEGKTTTAVNLSVLMAEAGYKTVLINCDFRLPNAHKLMGLEYLPGEVQQTEVEGLLFVADVQRAESETPGQISERQRQVIRQARQQADVVILDTAPVLATNDAIELLAETDLAVLVAKETKTTADAAREARELLIDRMGIAVAGVVITNAGAGMGSGYYEKYRYGSYFGGERGTMWQVFKAKFGRKKKAAKADEAVYGQGVEIDADATTSRFDLDETGAVPTEDSGEGAQQVEIDSEETLPADKPDLDTSDSDVDAELDQGSDDPDGVAEADAEEHEVTETDAEDVEDGDAGPEDGQAMQTEPEEDELAASSSGDADALADGSSSSNGHGVPDKQDKIVVEPVTDFDPLFVRPSVVEPVGMDDVAEPDQLQGADLEELFNRSGNGQTSPRHAVDPAEIDLRFEDAGHPRRARRAANPDAVWDD